MAIHIKKSHEGRFTAYKKRTGKTTAEALHSKDPHVRQMANFSRNTRKWHHKPDGGWIEQYGQGGDIKSYNPNLAKNDNNFQTWYNDNTLEGQNSIPYSDSLNYDYYSYYKNGNMNGNIKDHFPDTYKRPTHPTFSNESIYSTPENPGGQWEGENYNNKGKFQYRNAGRTINPVMGGQMIGGQHAYPPLAPYPPMYGFGGVLQSFAPFLSLIPGIGTAAGAALSLGAGMAGGMLEGAGKNKQEEEALVQQKHQQALQAAQIGQAGITGNARPTFSWGGRLPETRLPMSPSGLTLGHVPGYDSNSNYGGTNVPGIPPKGWNYRMVKGKGEGTNWHRETNMNVHRHTYPMGGQINDNLQMAPVELEKQEVYQTPSGQMGQVNGPSHAEGGIDMELPENSFVWSDKLKTAKGTTFADEAAKLGRLKAKYEKILRA